MSYFSRRVSIQLVMNFYKCDNMKNFVSLIRKQIDKKRKKPQQNKP